MIETSAPGKLFVLGEYSVVTPGEPAVLVAVNRYVRVRLSDSAHRETAQPAQEAAFSPARASAHVRAVLRVIAELCAERGIPERRYRLEIASELEDQDGRKFGLGSSAAVTVALVAAFDQFYGLGLSETERFKLALIATLDVSPHASGGDLAASTFGGWVHYRSPDRATLRAYRHTCGVAATFADNAWAGFSVHRLHPARAVCLLAAWTGTPAATDRLVNRALTAGGRGGAKRSPQSSAQLSFLAESSANVTACVSALRVGNSVKMQQSIRVGRRLLRQFGEQHGIAIETEALTRLCDIAERYGAAAKPSGAGGGDCGIALADTSAGDTIGATQSIVNTWGECGVKPLNLAVHDPLSNIPTQGDADAR